MKIIPEEISSRTQVNKLMVFTLGRFEVKKNNHSLTTAASGSKKIWALFKFMMTHRQRSFTPESLVDSLWSAEDYSDPRSTLRRQMHRLRQVLEESSMGSEQVIILNNGYYYWNSDLDVQIDTDLFEKSVQLGDALKENQPDKALIHFLMALSLYQGDYLSECIDQLWVLPIQNYYRRLYVKTVLDTTELLRELGDFNRILQICEKAIQLDIYKEEFHVSYMEALLQIGEREQALKHYEHITGFFYQEMGLKPSPAMKAIYKRILSTQAKHATMDALASDLEVATASENAFYCEPDIFRSIYELERRRSERNDVKAIVGMITMAQPLGVSLGQQQQRMLSLKQYLLEHLRKGDTVTHWNDSQFLVLLPGLDETKMENVLSRIVNLYITDTTANANSIQTQYHLILPLQESVI